MAAKVSHYAEYYALRGAIAALRVFGWKGVAATSKLLGNLAYSVVRIRREIVERQIAFAFPEFSKDDVQRVALASYVNLGRTVTESAMLPYRKRDFVFELVGEIDGWEIVEDALAQGRGMLIVTGHIGNWEFAGRWLAAKGLNIGAVARRMSNPLFADYLGKTRADMGAQIFYEADAVRLAPRHLRAGGILALLADQGVPGVASTFVPFFGRLARTPRGPAVLAIRFKTPLVYGTCIRQPDGRFNMTFERISVPDSGDRDADIDNMVAAYTKALERSVRLTPEQYFWMHRRWRRQPEGQPLLDEDQL